jgi:hypothetical protein
MSHFSLLGSDVKYALDKDLSNKPSKHEHVYLKKNRKD